MNNLLIGSTGLIGAMLQQHCNFDMAVHSTDINIIAGETFDLAVCAAPSSNRIIATQYPDADTSGVEKLIASCCSADIKKMILISSCDTQVRADTAYGQNRLAMELFVKQHYANYAILRLPALIDPNLKKNLLYDLKNQLFLNKLNPHSYMQWYPLADLPGHIESVRYSNNIEINLCSEPIGNWELIERFAPDLKSQINYNQTPGQIYNMLPYSYSRSDIFSIIEDYFR